MNNVQKHIFREYDVRGLADIELTDNTVTLIGRAFGVWLARSGVTKTSVGGDVPAIG